MGYIGRDALGAPALVNQATPFTLYTPQSGKRIALKWFGMATPNNNTLEIIVTVLLGSDQVYMWPMGNPGMFAHSSLRLGAKDAPLIVSCSAAQPLYCNFDLEEVS